MGHYLLIVAYVMILNLAMTENREQLFTRYPKSQAMGKVVKTLPGSSAIACAMACLSEESCTSYNMMVMADGKHCQLVEMSGTIANDNSTLYGKKHIQFTVQKGTNYIIRLFQNKNWA